MIAHKDSTVATKLGYVARNGVNCTAGKKLAASYKALRRERNQALAELATLRALATTPST
jgi:hypothetical protein